MPTGDLPNLVDLETQAWQLDLWHQYPLRLSDGRPVGASEFNPVSKARFAGRLALPPRAMFYAGSTPHCALWETPPLRDAMGKVVLLSRHEFQHQRLVQLRPLRALHLVDLGIKHLRAMCESKADIDLFEDLKQTDVHGRTHPAAAAILAFADANARAVDGLMWRSKQHGTDSVILLYGPPVSTEDLVVLDDTLIALDDPREGWPIIDATLAQAGMRRATVDDDGDVLADAPCPP